MGIEFKKPLIIGDIDASVKEDISQLKQDVSDMETDIGNLNELDTVDKSSVVNAINEALSVLDPTQTSDYINNSKGLKSGEVSTNSTIINDIKDYAHSTFDKSKFTTSSGWSGVITEDGFASGFSDSSYINKTLFSTALTETDNFVFTFAFKATNVSAAQNICNLRASYLSSPYFYIDASSKLRMAYTNTSNTTTYGTYGTITANTLIVVKLVNNNGTTKIYVNGVEYNVSNFTCTIKGFYTRFANTNFTGSIDLKYVSFEVDGVPVFSGNKTGIDTIKADDYTVVGTPTISADGIASGFSNSNKIRIPVFDSTKPFQFDFQFNTLTFPSVEEDIIRDGSTYLRITIDGQHKFVLRLGTTGWGSDIVSYVSSALSANTSYNISFVFTGTAYKIYMDGVLKKTVNTTTTKALTGNLTISPTNDSATTSSFTGSINLNALKIYVDGDLVYQPCLKIPYTESKTGSKIVSSTYRDRVDDMADQFGYANYYTLDEDNGNFTLPQVELYGFIERQGDRPSNKYISLSLGASGDTYVAPSNGYFMLSKASANIGEYAVLTNEANGIATINSAVTAGNNVRVWLPVKKNDVIKLQYTTTGLTNLFRFIYSEGSEGEAK